MGQDFPEFSKQWSRLHGGASTRGFVGIWLKISFRVVGSLARVGITPNGLTLLGVIFALLVCLSSPNYWAIGFLALSLACDGLDGSLAIFKKNTNKFGSLLDALADRIAEGLWAIAFYRLGAPLYLVAIGWVLAGIQEYARARLGSAGVHEIGVVTPSERPVRAIFLFLAVLAWQFSFSQDGVALLATVFAILQLFSLFLVLRFAKKSLS